MRLPWGCTPRPLAPPLPVRTSLSAAGSHPRFEIPAPSIREAFTTLAGIRARLLRRCGIL